MCDIICFFFYSSYFYVSELQLFFGDFFSYTFVVAAHRETDKEWHTNKFENSPLFFKCILSSISLCDLAGHRIFILAVEILDLIFFLNVFYQHCRTKQKN